MIKRLQIFKLIPIFLLFMGLSVNAQVQYNFLDDFGASLFGINDNGKGVHGNGYYDFNTNVSTPPEADVFGTTAINNDETILGLMDDGGDFVPGLRVGGVWTAFPASVPLTDEDTLYAISDNGVWVVGQTSWNPATNTSWGFIYNTQTEEFKLLDASGVYEYSAAYDVNNDGYAVGWVDDLPVGTFRMPAIFSPDGTITIISSTDDQGAANGISNNGMVVGETEGEAFIYNMASGDLTVFPNTAGYLSTNFSDISENGVAVGYAELPGFLREPILYHSSLSAEPVLLSDFLDDHGINDDVEGSAYKISRNGKYICGFGDGPAFMAPGFALYLDDVIEDDEPADDYCIPEGDSFFDWIESFSTTGGIENIDNVSGNNGGYGDFYDTHNVTQEQGGEVSFATEFSDGFDTYGFRIWVDWNQDGVFDTTEEVAWASTSYSESHSGSFTVPSDAALGSTRMRIVNSYWESDGDEDPCDDSGAVWGEYEDYKFTVVEGGGQPDPGEDCEQDYYISGTNPANYDNGLNVTDLPTVSFWGANDVIVEAGESFKLETITFDAISLAGNPTNFRIQIYEDNGSGGVGAPTGSMYTFGSADYTYTTSGSYSGFDVFRMVFDMSGEDINFDNTSGTDVAYWWVAIQADPTSADSSLFWLVDFHNGNPSNLMWQAEDGAWTVNDDDYEGAMKVEGICSEEGGGSSGEDCDQGDVTNPAGVDNGFGITLGDVYDVADDFFVSAGNTLNIQTIKLNLLAMNKIDHIEIEFYEDDGAGLPGTLMTQSVITDVLEADQIQVGTAFGFNQYEVYIDVDLDFTEGHYWMSPHASELGGGSVYWEQTFVGTHGQPTSVRNTTLGDDWSVNDDSSQSVFTLYCDETDVPDEPELPCEFDITFSIEPITRVVFAGIDNISSAVVDGSPALEDFTHIEGNVEADGTYNVALEGNTDGAWTNYFTVFIKWNEGDSWSDYSTFEIGSINGSTGTDGQQATNTITIPADAAEGTYTMRVVKSFGDSPLDPCGEYFYGQAEDYTLIVGEGDGPIGDECEQGVDSFDDLPNAYGITLGSSFRVAEDIIVEEGVIFTMNQITLDTNQQDLPDYIEINIREDNAGEPGAIMETLTFDEDDYTWEIVGTAFGDPIYHMTFNLTNSIVFEEGVYWLDPKMSAPGGGSVWWAATDQDSFGAAPMFSGDDGASWEADTEGLSMIYTVSGYCETLGTNNLTGFDFTYYPNPVKDVLYINSSKKVESVQVYNLAGQEVMKQSKQLSTANQIDVTTLPSGVYIFRAVLEGGQIETFKVIKK